MRRALLGLVFSWCICSPAQAYTVKQTGSGATVRWHRPSVTLRVDPSVHAFFEQLAIKRVVNDAASAWEGLSGVPELLISAGNPGPSGFDDSNSEPDNGLYVLDEWTPFAENSLAVTVATFETVSGRIVDTDIFVNRNHPFGVMPDGPDQPAESFDLGGVLTHEMGHVLGLGESFEVRYATMWPNIARGETHQRDLDDDDMAGAEEAYAGVMLADVDTAGNACSRSSVALSPSQGAAPGAWLATGGLLIGLGLWMRRSRTSRAKASISMLALGLLFTTPLRPQSDTDHERVEVVRTLLLRRLDPTERRQGVLEASRSDSTAVRLAATAVLERVGTREDQDIAARMVTDRNEEVREAAARALQRLRTAPPAARLAKTDPKATARLATLFGGSTQVLAGEVVQAGAAMRNGLIWSRFLVHGKNDVVEVDIPGGTLGAFSQVVSEQEPPQDGDSIVVAVRPDGKRAWAHLRQGLVYGGWLGDGPAIEW